MSSCETPSSDVRYCLPKHQALEVAFNLASLSPRSLGFYKEFVIFLHNDQT